MPVTHQLRQLPDKREEQQGRYGEIDDVVAHKQQSLQNEDECRDDYGKIAAHHALALVGREAEGGADEEHVDNDKAVEQQIHRRQDNESGHEGVDCEE